MGERFRNEQIVDLVGNLGPVGRPELSHYVADVNLHGAFAHVEFIGDDLVGLAAAERHHYIGLARREHAGKMLGAVAAFYHLAHGHDRVGRNEYAPGDRQLDRLDAHGKADRRRDIAACAAFQCAQDMLQLLAVAEYDDRNGGEVRGSLPDRVRSRRLRQLQPANAEDDDRHRPRGPAVDEPRAPRSEGRDVEFLLVGPQEAAKAFPVQHTRVDYKYIQFVVRQ